MLEEVPVPHNGRYYSVAVFHDGEKVFSKYYTPYVLDQEQCIVNETNVKSLQSGDTLIFTRYTE